jgi:S-DNA-T family DNA segregation ATPase FtsK/SpoIIIE
VLKKLAFNKLNKNKRNKPKSKPLISSKLYDSPVEMLAIVMAVITVYFLIILLSFNKADPGWFNTGTGDEIKNFGGTFGAYFSDLVLQAFGYFAYFLPILFAYGAYKLHKLKVTGEELEYSRASIVGIGVVLTIVGGCVLESLHFGHLAQGQPFVGGGFLGNGLRQSLVSAVGLIGTTLMALVAFLYGVTMFSKLSWFWLMDTIGEKTCDLIEWAKNFRQERQDRAIGETAKELRDEVLSPLREKKAVAKPIKIEPKIAAPVVVDSGRREREKQVNLFEADESSEYSLPPLNILDEPEQTVAGYSSEELQAMSTLLVKKLADFKVDVDVVSVHQGPVITRFEVEPAPGVKASSIVSLSKDLARAMSTMSVRVVENIPGKSVIGIEIPNEHREVVKLIEGLSSKEFDAVNSPLSLVLGKDIGGETVIADLQKMPHVLIAGTTGSGKSVCINALIISMLYKATPKEVRMIMVDPKMLELSVYEDIPHLLSPVVTDMNEAANALRWSIYEMERRYKLMSALGVRNLAGYNKKIQQGIAAGEPEVDPFAKEGMMPDKLEEMPCLVIVIDELADLMMVVGKKVEELITRLAQKGRASGIHLLLATQRPSVDVITGLLKANIPARIAFQVSSKVDSRTVLDQMGAEHLLGHGDMLFLPPGTSIPERVHGSFVSDQEVHKVVEHLKTAGAPQYDDAVINGPKEVNQALPTALQAESNDPEDDPLYDEAVAFVTQSRKSSISAVQRQLRVGYNRAARMIETMEQAGIVGPLEHGKREIYAPAPPED